MANKIKHDAFLKEIHRRRMILFLWTPVFIGTLLIIIPITAIILKFTNSTIPQWSGNIINIVWPLGLLILAIRLSRVPCPECGYLPFRLNECIFVTTRQPPVAKGILPKPEIPSASAFSSVG
jgi:hypothetical protein